MLLGIKTKDVPDSTFGLKRDVDCLYTLIKYFLWRAKWAGNVHLSHTNFSGIGIDKDETSQILSIIKDNGLRLFHSSEVLNEGTGELEEETCFIDIAPSGECKFDLKLGGSQLCWTLEIDKSTGESELNYSDNLTTANKQWLIKNHLEVGIIAELIRGSTELM